MTQISEQIKELGATVLEEAISTTFMQGDSNPLCVVQTAHAAELLIKARIAEEKESAIYKAKGKFTIGYRDLPNALQKFDKSKYLWLEKSSYSEFGKLRNKVQHHTVPEGRDVGRESADFIFSVIDPLIYDFWKDSVFNYLNKDIDYLDQFIFSDLYKMGIGCHRIPDSLQDIANIAKQQIERCEEVAAFVSQNYDDDPLLLQKNFKEAIERLSTSCGLARDIAQKSLVDRYHYLRFGWCDWTTWIC